MSRRWRRWKRSLPRWDVRCGRTIANKPSCRAEAGRSRIRTVRRRVSSRLRGDGKFVACMPGVPREMKPMLAEQLIPFLRERLGTGEAIYTRVLHTIGVGESEIDHRIDDLFRAGENPKIAVLAHDFRADVKIMAKSRSPQAARGDRSRRCKPRSSAAWKDTSLGAMPIRRRARFTRCFGRADEMLAVAESCTGGRISAALTSVPGASKSFAGGVVAYDNAVKVERSSASTRATIDRYGAVSEEVAREMARGVRARLRADVALATTGIAGPDGGYARKAGRSRLVRARRCARGRAGATRRARRRARRRYRSARRRSRWGCSGGTSPNRVPHRARARNRLRRALLACAAPPRSSAARWACPSILLTNSS